ncbi:hypothetical protein PFISCL1PPCAC_17845, partial [Pristionchus fissidentatus]
LNQMAKFLLLFLLLISTFNQGHCGHARTVTVRGDISCIDANQASRPMPKGTVNLMEMDGTPPGGSFWKNFQDTDDIKNTTNLLNFGKFEISGDENEDSYDVKCYMGVKTCEGTYEGFSCIGGLTPGRGYLPRETYTP